MTLDDVVREIEGNHFAAEVNLASGSVAFDRGLRSHPLFHELAESVRGAQGRDLVIARLEELARKPIDFKYENPYDAAMTAYLTALSQVERPELLEDVVEAVLKTPNCWWAREISTRLQADIARRRAANGLMETGAVSGRQAMRLGNSGMTMSSTCGLATGQEPMFLQTSGYPDGSLTSVRRFARSERRPYRHRGAKRSRKVAA